TLRSMAPSKRMIATPNPISSVRSPCEMCRSTTPVMGPRTRPAAMSTTMAGSRSRAASHWLPRPVARITSRSVALCICRAYARSASTCVVPRREVTYNQMVVENELSVVEVDRIFRALADSTRRDIVRRTLEAESTVSHLAAAYQMSFAAVQKHVAVLEGAGLVTKQQQGRERLVRGNPAALRRAQALLDQYEHLWRSRIDRLDAILADDQQGE